MHNAEYNFEHGILMTPAITSCSPCFLLVFYLILLAGSFLLSVSLDEGLPILSIYSHIFFVSILHSMFQPDIWIILRFAGKPAKMLRVMIKKVRGRLTNNTTIDPITSGTLAIKPHRSDSNIVCDGIAATHLSYQYIISYLCRLPALIGNHLYANVCLQTSPL